ncbi:outer membrane beta-barrel family protein [Bacteroides sp. 519]|uniref:outer membrane beta-barrel family protein n=1 Tax=Bacteroides sp. 519 TaxID=2302937 RepID=UPI0013D440CA|nr:outer membrane beta-barrel family protein [Bacteroides sp. 519]NDV59764.1 signal protein [Bacteroides sp. 519]
MKRLLILSTIFIAIASKAQIQVNDSTYLFLDSLFMNLPEVMVTGEQPIVKADQGKLTYDLPRMVSQLPVDNALDAIKELPGVVDMDGLTLAGKAINIIIDGKVSTLSYEQLTQLLQTIPVSRIEKAEVMYAAPARYQVRGPMINLILKKDNENSNLTGELFSSWLQRQYGSFRERASLLYSSSKFSADLLYSYNRNKNKQTMDKEALHTVNGTVYPMNLSDRLLYRSHNHNIRLGMDYTFAQDNVLSMVYTTNFSNYDNNGVTSGTQNSIAKRTGNDQLHNVKLDYRTPFGLSTGAEFTFYKSPGKQHINSTMNDEEISIQYDELQKINSWKFHATQEHSLSNNWGLNYGAYYSTTVDNSFQNYYDMETGKYNPEKSMKARRKEYTVNGFAGFSKAFGEKVSMDASFAAELYNSDIWNEWMFYPTLNVNYLASPGNMFQFSLSSDKRYPEFWSINNSIAYLSTYSEIHGNPDLKPSVSYNTSLTYILKSKYIFTAFFNHQPDYFVQALYQDPTRLTEVYKYLNFDYQQQFGVQMVIPFKIGNWLNSRITTTGYNKREKDNDFWDIPFNRNHTSFMVSMNNSITLSTQPNLLLNISGYYQNGSIQGIYDLSRSGALNASLRWKSDNQKFTVTLKGNDLLGTEQVNPKIKFKGQHVSNRFSNTTRGVEVSFSYQFGNHKEKQREEVDTSRFK